MGYALRKTTSFLLLNSPELLALVRLVKMTNISTIQNANSLFRIHVENPLDIPRECAVSRMQTLTHLTIARGFYRASAGLGVLKSLKSK